PDHIRAYLVSLQRRGLKDNSQHAAAGAIRAWLNFLVREELLIESPMRKVGMPRRGHHILPALARDDVKKLLDACLTARDKAIVLSLLDSGCRAAEFVALNVGDVDIKSGAITIHEGKGRKDRTTFLG